MRGRVNQSSVVTQAEQYLREVQGISGDGVTIPVWLFASGVGLLAGIILGPAIMATTSGGSAYLANLARTRIGG